MRIHVREKEKERVKSRLDDERRRLRVAMSGGRLDGGAHVAMISIPMLLTRRGCLGRATPYFLSLSVRLASLHAPRDRDPILPLHPDLRRGFSLAIFYSVIFASTPFASCVLSRSLLQKYLSSASMQNCSHQLFDSDQYRCFSNERHV